MSNQRPIGIYYEHPEWFKPLFRALDRRGVYYEALRADRLIHDPARGFPDHFSLFFNRMSPSAWQRGRGGAVFETLGYLSWLESRGVPVINGSDAYRLEISKAAQLALPPGCQIKVAVGVRLPSAGREAGGGRCSRMSRSKLTSKGSGWNGPPRRGSVPDPCG